MKPRNFQFYKTLLETVLTIPRLNHSIGVMQVMGDLARVYKLEQELALTAGLLHDAAKDLPVEQWMALVQKASISITNEQDNDYLHYLHGPVSATLVKERLNIQDPLMLGAIASHTYYGDSPYFNHPLTWCLRFSDILEPNRNWQSVRWLSAGVPILRMVVFEGKLDLAAFLQTGWLIDWFSETGKPVHPNMWFIFEDLSRRLGLSHSDLYKNDELK